MTRIFSYLLPVWMSCALLAWPLGAQETPKVPDYAKHVAPIFQLYCTSCHNADDREGGLSLESYADLMQGGDNGAALFPGQIESRLLLMIEGKLAPKMPPDNAEGPSADDIALLKAWVDSGARGPAGAEPQLRTLRTPKLPSPKDAGRVTSAMALSPQGDTVAVGQFGRVVLVDAASGEARAELKDIAGKVNGLAFSTDGEKLVVASGIAGLHGQATLWNVKTGARLAEFVGHRDTMYDADLSPDGAWLATGGYDRKILVWNVGTKEVVRTLEGHNGAIFDVAFSPDGQAIASASADETVKLWRTDTGERLDTLSQPEAEQYAVAFSPDGQFVVAGGADNRIRVWRFISREKPRINPILHARFAHEGAILELAFSRDGSLLASAAEDGTLKVWDTDSYLERHLYEEQPELTVGLALTPDARNLIVARLDGTRALLPVPEATTRHSGGATSVAERAADSASAPMSETAEQEPNNQASQAQVVAVPARIKGVILAADGESSDADCYRFAAKAGEQWMVEINAARQKSPLDSRVEVLSSDGKPIPRVQLQAVRDSYFTFRGKDSDTVDDFRVHNWEEMELNEYLYAGGEVVKLWLYPRGPDSGFKVYPGAGKRYNFFDTTPMSHALHEPCYIVRPSAPGTELIPNGLPVFHLFYENDDDALRAWGTDSRLTFTAPADGEYVVRVTDVRGFQGADHSYELTLRPRRPEFEVSLSGADPTVGAGSGREFVVNAQRRDGFDGEIRVDIDGLPPGFHVTTPIVIEAGQISATGIVYVDPEAPAPTAENAKASRVTATATIDGHEVTKDVNNLGQIKLGDKPKLLVRVFPDEPSASDASTAEWQPWELTIAPGETITAKVKIERNGFEGRVPFGNEDSGRNLPHGVFVDNIGLNGLLIVEGKSERTFFVTSAKWVPGQTRWFYLKSRVEGDQTSWPVLLRVVPKTN